MGGKADFNQAYESEGYGGDLDPKKPHDWPEKRILRPQFLETILLHEPYSGAIPRQGVQIIGAWFKDRVDLSNAVLSHLLILGEARFDSDVDLIFLKSPHLISFIGSKFTGKLDMNSLQVDEHLLMSERAEFNEVSLTASGIGGQLIMSGSKFTGKLKMESLQVDDALFMFKGKFNEAILAGTQVGGLLDMSGSKFMGELDMNSLQVDGHLFMIKGAEFNEVSLIMGSIGGGVYLSGGVFSLLDLTGARIKGELSFGVQGVLTIWKKGARLTLRNTEVGTLQENEGSWPDQLELTGFTYSRLGGYGTGSSGSMEKRDIKKLTAWLEQQDHYSPQPYEQLAKVLRESGLKEKAREILYAGKERERREATGISKIGLGLINLTVGYGYKISLSLIWVALFTAIGAHVLQFGGQGIANGMPYGISYSLDMLLPIIKLRELHYTIDLHGFTKYYFYFHKLMGYFLASMLIAGLSGITKK